MAIASVDGFLKRLTRGMAADALRGQTDSQLVKQFLARAEEGAFEAIVRRHGAMVYRVCWRVLRKNQDTEDAFQATFLLLAQKLPTLRKHESLASWLHGVAHRVALQAKGRAAQQRRHEQRAARTAAERPGDPSAEELLAVLDDELVKLPDKWRLPLILCYLQGRTQDEAAGQLGLTKITLRRRLDEARAALGRRLSRRGVGPAALSAVLLSDCVALAVPPAGLVRSTVEAGTSIAAGAGASSVVPGKLAALTEGVMTTMRTSKLKIATAALVLAVVVVTSGSIAARFPALATQQASWKVGAVAAPAPAPKESRLNWFPTKESVTRVYELRDGDRVVGGYTDVVTRVEKKHGVLHVTVTRDYGEKDPYVTTIAVSNKGLLRVAINGRALEKPSLLLKTPPKVGATWDVGRAKYEVTKEEEVEVPAGRFKAVRVKLSDGGAESTFWFAPNVGVIKLASTTGPVVQVLKEVKAGK